MTPPEQPPTPPEIPNPPDGFTWLIHQALFLLTPFFMDGAGGDETCARAAAKELLASYRVASAEELQLVTECIVYAYAAMDTLRQDRAAPEIPDHRRLRLRNNAVALSRASHRNRRSLDALRKRRTPAPEPRLAQPEPHPLAAQLDPAAIMQDLHEKIAQHRERMAATRTQADRTASPARPVLPHAIANQELRRAAERIATR